MISRKLIFILSSFIYYEFIIKIGLWHSHGIILIIISDKLIIDVRLLLYSLLIWCTNIIIDVRLYNRLVTINMMHSSSRIISNWYGKFHGISASNDGIPWLYPGSRCFLQRDGRRVALTSQWIFPKGSPFRSRGTRGTRWFFGGWTSSGKLTSISIGMSWEYNMGITLQ